MAAVSYSNRYLKVDKVLGIGWVGGEGQFLVKARKCHSDVADRGRKVVDRKQIEGVAKTAAGKELKMMWMRPGTAAVSVLIFTF